MNARTFVREAEQIEGLFAECDSLVERLRVVDSDLAKAPSLGLWATKLKLLIELKELEAAIRAWGAARGKHDASTDGLRGVDWRSAAPNVGPS